jgi:hypothetical protein
LVVNPVTGAAMKKITGAAMNIILFGFWIIHKHNEYNNMNITIDVPYVFTFLTSLQAFPPWHICPLDAARVLGLPTLAN